MLHGHARVTSCNVNTFSLRLLYLLLCYREKWRCADLQTFSPLKSTNFDQRSASIRNPGSSESPRPQMTSPEMRAMQFIGGTLSTRYSLIDNNNHHNNNSPICKAPECRKTSVAIADRNSRANYTGLKVLRNRNVLSLDLNTASEPLPTVQLFREFQTVGAVQRKARSAKCVLVVGFCSSRCDEERR